MFGLGNTNTIITERESVEDKGSKITLGTEELQAKVGQLVSATLQLGMRLMT